MLRRPLALVLVTAGWALGSAACDRPAASPSPPEARAADPVGATPSSAPGAASRAGPSEPMWAVLRGESDDLAGAEAALEQALADATGPRRDALAMRLGRFYNVRALRGDASRADRQAQVYAELWGANPDPSALDLDRFRAWCFSQLGALLAQRHAGRMLAALATVRRVEDALSARLAAEPDDVELHALAGNFAVFFAGNVPFDREARTRRAEGHLTIVFDRWDELRALARDPTHCPNTRTSYAFELAETRLALGDVEAARSVYEWLVADAERDPTPVKRQFAWIADDRLARATALAGELALMPPWPSDAENCVVCHGARPLALDTLFSPPARPQSQNR